MFLKNKPPGREQILVQFTRDHRKSAQIVGAKEPFAEEFLEKTSNFVSGIRHQKASPKKQLR